MGEAFQTAARQRAGVPVIDVQKSRADDDRPADATCCAPAAELSR
ncbi:hypothetical protein [Aurantimonas sp. 22II-16-19i]|nr:hypothetical protein [Aurantimonas sp. 22II-16-19i]